MAWIEVWQPCTAMVFELINNGDVRHDVVCVSFMCEQWFDRPWLLEDEMPRERLLAALLVQNHRLMVFTL